MSRGEDDEALDSTPFHGIRMDWSGFPTLSRDLLKPSSKNYRTACGDNWPAYVVYHLNKLAVDGLFDKDVMQLKNKQQKREAREIDRERMRAEHVLKAMKAKGIAQEIKDAFIKARFGGDLEIAKSARTETKRQVKFQRGAKAKATHPGVHRHAAQERQRMVAYAPRSIAEQALKEGNPFIRRTAKYRANCKHKWKKITSEWSQCKLCAWCKPRIPEDEMLRLPPILEGRELPPLSEDQQWINMRSVNTLAGVVLSKICRAKQVQYSFQHDPYILRYGIEVKFKNGWKAAGIFFETAWYRILPVLQANGDKPKRLWRAIQKELGLDWWPPWQVHPRLIPLGERMALYRCADCSFTRRPGWCSRHMSNNERYKEEKRREEERDEASEKAKRKALRRQAKARRARETEGKSKGRT